MRRVWLAPLVPLYGLGVWLAERLRPEPRALGRPVISVGSLSAGGAGKTPVVKALAELLARHGVAADVLSRGYGRGSDEVLRVDPAGLRPEDAAARFGDEPLELAQAGIAVWVGADRFHAGQAAEAAGAVDVHLLDDGFQHRRLRRALDLVLATAQDLDDTLLPAGNLREPLRALRRADVLVVRAEEAASLQARLRVYGKPIWIIHRELRLPSQLPARPLAFCGLARPESFFSMLAAAGVAAVRTVAFPDHHAYTAADQARLVRLAREAGADGFLTTAKDAVKIAGEDLELLAGVGQLIVVALQVRFENEASTWGEISRHLR